jgi:acyl transferase domain-containing protein
VSTDTACSSSLVAAHLAKAALAARECGSALAAGVNALLGSRTFVKICALQVVGVGWMVVGPTRGQMRGAALLTGRKAEVKAVHRRLKLRLPSQSMLFNISFLRLPPPSPQALSPVGRCRTFDAAADGYGRGEGFAALLLTQQTGAAAAQPRRSLAVLRSSAVNSAGRSSGLTAPSGPAQQALVAAALAAGQLAAAELALLAVHGTGTQLGDPIGTAPAACFNLHACCC